MPVPPFPPSQTVHSDGQRILWIDMARGVGIFLVVLAHCLRGLTAAGIMAHTPFAEGVDQLIYAFHMPLFFLLSGLTFEAVARKRAPATFLRDRALRLLWPLALWTWIFFAFRMLAGSRGNTHVSWAEFPWIPLPPQDHLWFLWALFVLGVTFYFLRRIWVARLGEGGLPGFWCLCLAVSGLLAHWMPVPALLGPWLVPAVIHAPGLLAGVILARLAPPAPGAAGTALAALTFGLSLALVWLYPEPIVTLLVALIAPLALVRVLQGLTAVYTPPGPLARGIVVLGQASMAIFLTHTIFSAALRIGFLQLGLRDAALHLLLGTSIGLIAPLLLWRLSQRLRLTKWLGF